MQIEKKRFWEKWRIIALFLVIYDALVINISYLATLWLRFDCSFSQIPTEYWNNFWKFAPLYTVFSIMVFFLLKLYNSIWKYASFSEFLRVIAATFFTGTFHLIGMSVLFGNMPISYFLVGPLFQFIFLIGIRFAYRFVLLERNRRNRIRSHNVKRVMIVGAGNAGQMILRDIHRLREEKMKAICIIDDDPNKQGRSIDGVPIVGNRNDILLEAKDQEIDLILIAMPRASAVDRRDILNICKETGCELKNLPGMYQLVNGRLGINDMKDVAVEDLLGREPIKVDMGEIYNAIAGRTVLVTGGGGSIGSELCRQVAAHRPKQLIIFDVYENNAYSIQMELREKYPSLDLVVLIGSVRDSRRIYSVFADYKPDIVYHAAAHKHVPLMEDSPCESIKNNVIGTYKTAYAAMLNGCKRFVLISTDKAVNPTNIMGASKRLCEMVIQSFDRAVKSDKTNYLPQLFTHYVKDMGEFSCKGPFVTEFVAVRFGNVLGSNGSVIPLFKKQIAKGGPVTVTHPDIIRYFMTIPEAVSLVMQAGVYAKGGEIFILDMGAPMKIDDLARNLIKLSGKQPDVDIPILYTGLRPGEKLYEEKLMAEEGLQKTDNELIHIGKPMDFDVRAFLSNVKDLMDAAYCNEPDIRERVAAILPTYHPDLEGEKSNNDTFRTMQAAMSKVASN